MESAWTEARRSRRSRQLYPVRREKQQHSMSFAPLWDDIAGVDGQRWPYF